jgi:hypothetical protein
VYMPWLLPVLSLVVAGFHQAPACCRRQFLSTVCNGETTVACNNEPSWSPWRGESGIFIRSGWVHDPWRGRVWHTVVAYGSGCARVPLARGALRYYRPAAHHASCRMQGTKSRAKTTHRKKN